MPLVWGQTEVSSLGKRAQISRGGCGCLAGFHGLSGDVGCSGELLKSLPKSLDGCLVMGEGGGGVWWCQGGVVVVGGEEKSFRERECEFRKRE